MASGSSVPRIFVSYARSDGKAFAGEVRQRLQEDEDFPVWQDLADLEGGRDWWQQIVEAIDHVEYLVLVMTPAALASPIVRKEWRYARQEGKCVIPVIGPSGIDFETLPGWMRRTHFVDPDDPDQWRRLVRTLEAPCRAVRAPMMVDDLPEDFVRRPAEFDALVAMLLDRTREEPVAITAALKGAGGYGKTTLARAICHEEAVQNAFEDGILWVTLGEEPGDVQSHIVDLIEVLTGQRPGFKTISAARTRLGEVIGGRRMLIVIDDVWRAADARPFLQEGPNCSRLVTTRNRDTLPPKAKAFDVDAMKVGEAIKLLRFGLPDGEDATLAGLVRRLGEWPLLLKLVNSALHRRHALGEPFAAALAWVSAGLDSRGLTAFDARSPIAREDAVAKTLGVSLELLNDDERARFSELAIFPEDLDVPLAVVEMLWSQVAGLNRFDTDDLCRQFYDQSLLLNLDLAARRIRLHAVISAYLRAERNEKLSALHIELIEAYCAHCPSGWHDGPDDGYFFQYLPWHLIEAERRDDGRTLALDYLWLRRKLEVAPVSGLIDDLDRLGGGDLEAGLVRNALQSSAHVLEKEPRQLASQLLGRLCPEDLPTAAGGLLEAARALGDRPTLLPLRRLLTPPGGPLLSTLERHGDVVLAVAVTPDGRRAVSASDDRTLKVWDLEQGALLSTREGHGSGVLAVAVTPDGRRAVSGSEDRTLKVWDLEQGALVSTLEGHGSGVLAVAVTPDGRHAVSGSSDRALKVWNLEQGALLSTLESHGSGVRAVAVTPDGRHAVSASDDRTLKVWDLEQRALLSTLEGHSGWVLAVVVTPDGRRAVSGADDRTLRLWDLETAKQLAAFTGDAAFTCCAVTPDGRVAVAGDAAGQVHVLEILL